MKFSHIIWDYDGTLFNTYPVMASALCTVIKKYNIIESVDNITALMKVSMKHTVEYFNKKYQLNESFWKEYKEFRNDFERVNVLPFDGAAEACAEIKKLGGSNYLLTHRGESYKYFFEKFKLTTNFTECISAEHHFPRKPSPEAILYLIKKYEFSPDAALMIGDRDIDIMAGINAGIHTCYYSDGKIFNDKAEFNITRFSELFA